MLLLVFIISITFNYKRVVQLFDTQNELPRSSVINIVGGTDIDANLNLHVRFTLIFLVLL